MSSQLDEISEAIGSLRSDVKNLNQTLSDNTRRADLHRAVIHKRVDEVVAEFGKLSAAAETIESKVDAVEAIAIEAKAVTDQVKMWEQRGMGALAVIGVAGTLLGGTIVGFVVYWWDAIMRLMRSI